MITNPEDTGIFNPRIRDYTQAAHDVGALCYYDQANLNGILGISRAREAGFDACHFNLHKTFSSPHGCKGPGAGALGVAAGLVPYLPAPHIVAVEDESVQGGTRYHLDAERPHAIGKLRAFLGNLAVVVRAYAWTMSLGARGLREVAEVSLINNNYLESQLREIRGISYPYAEGHRRLDQIRYSFGRLQRGHRLRHGGHEDEILRLRGADLVHESSPLDRPGAVHAGALRDLLQGRHRLLGGGDEALRGRRLRPSPR